jgi:hypothetical protein
MKAFKHDAPEGVLFDISNQFTSSIEDLLNCYARMILTDFRFVFNYNHCCLFINKSDPSLTEFQKVFSFVGVVDKRVAILFLQQKIDKKRNYTAHHFASISL